MDFEEQFGRSLREAGDSYTVDAQPLLERSLRRGRALRGRRIAYAVVASAASVALIVAGTALSSTVARPPSGTEQSSVSGAWIANQLEKMLPSGSVSGARGIGAGGGRPDQPAGAELVYNDGKGASQLQLTFTRKGYSTMLGDSTCPARKQAPSILDCEESRLHDGSIVKVEKGTFGTSHVLWTATLTTASGDRAWLDEFNSSTSETSSPVTRAAPPLSAAQLTAIVTNSAWSPVLAAVHAAQPDGQPSQTQVNAIMKQLQPAGFRFGTYDEKENQGISELPVSKDGAGSSSQGHTQLMLRVQRWPGQARDEIRAEYFAGTTPLPDGTLITVNTYPGASTKGLQVSALRPDGIYIWLNENAAGPGKPLLLSLAQLKSIAQSPLWSR